MIDNGHLIKLTDNDTNQYITALTNIDYSNQFELAKITNVKVEIYAGNETVGAAYEVTGLRIFAGNTLLPWEEAIAHQSITLITSNGLPGIPVTSGGNYTDENGQQWVSDEIDFARGVRIRRIGSTTFDGSDDESWEYDTSKLAFRCKISDDILRSNVPDNESRVLNTHYKYDFGVWNDVVTHRGYVVNFDVISIRNLSVDTVTSFRELLSVSPVTVRYILSNPVETPLSDGELLAYKALYTNYKNNTILSEAGMKVTYATDTKLYIDNKFAELQSTIS
jgi:hypothetical protein